MIVDAPLAQEPGRPRRASATAPAPGHRAHVSRRRALAIALTALPLLGAADLSAATESATASRPGSDAGLRINAIQVFPRDPRPERGEQVIIAFKTNHRAAGMLSLYGPDGILVREFLLPDPGDTAPRRVLWDCTDSDGTPVPAEAYTLRIEMRDRNGQEAVYDAAAVSGGDLVEVRNPRYLSDSEQVAYSLDRAARVSIRSGIDQGGPLLRTLLDGRPRLAGSQRELWDGRDADGRVRVVELPSHRLDAQAVALPDHAILVRRDDGPSWPEYSNPLAGQRPTRPVPDPGAPDSEPILLPRVDPPPHFALSIPSPVGYRDGLPVVAGSVGLRVALDPAIKRRIIEERFEVVLFVDTRFETETEEGYSPSTLVWDSTGHADGKHLLTVNLVTLTGRTSTASIPVIVANLPEPAPGPGHAAGPDDIQAR